MEQSDTDGLQRGLTYWGAVSVVIGNVIGTGIFLKSRIMTCNVSDPATVFLVWTAAGLLSLAGALTYAELTSMMPKAAGEYVIVREAYGRPWAFLHGWTQFAISLTGSQAAKAVIIAIMVNVLSAGMISRTFFTIDFFGHPVPIGWIQIIAISSIWIMTLLNCAEVAVSNKIIAWITGLKVLLVFAIGIAAFLFSDGKWIHFAMQNSGGTCEGVSSRSIGGIGGFAAAMLGALWAYDGWNTLSNVAGEVKHPQKNIPLALISGMGAVIFLYLFTNAAYYFVLSPTDIASVSVQSSVATEVMTRILGSAAAILMAVSILTSSTGSMYTGIMAAARIPFAMSRDSIFFRKMGTLSPRTLVPVTALIVQAVWISILAVSGSFDTLTDYAMFASWIFYGMATASVFLFRRRLPDVHRPYRTWGYPVVPALFLGVTAWLLVNIVVTAPLRSFIGLSLICLGFPLYFYFVKKNRL